MKIIKENVYDISTQQRFKLTYNSANKLIKIDRKTYKNRLYFLDEYAIDPDRDFIWITDDDYVIQIDDRVLEIIVDTENFINQMRDLKTADKITNYIKFLQL